MDFYYQSRRKAKKNVLKKGAAGIFLLAASAISIFCLLAPGSSGAMGRAIHGALLQFSGWASLIIAAYIGLLGFSYMRTENNKRFAALLTAAAALGLWIFSASVLSLMSSPFVAGSGSWGGFIGDGVSQYLTQQFGRFLTFVISLAAVSAAGFFITGVSPVDLAKVLAKKVKEDLEEWSAERKKIGEEKLLKKKIEQKADGSGDLQNQKISADIPGGQNHQKPNIRIDELLLKPKIAEAAKAAPPKNGKAPEKPVKAATASEPAPVSEMAEQPVVDAYPGYVLPDPDLLSFSENALHVNKEELYTNGTLLEKTLEQFGVKAKVVDIHPGPVITRYDLSPAPGVRVQQIESLASDIALAMKAQSIRVLAPVPGKAAVGIEIPNPHPAMVYLKEILLSPQFQKTSMVMPLGIGKTTEGEAFVSDLTSMPHLLIAGSTGSGKSVCIHGLILSLLFRFRPDEVKLLLIDPKRLELPAYDSIPHLYDPSTQPEDAHVITDSKDVMRSLKKLVDVMEDRYRSFAKHAVRNIEGYNKKAQAENRAKVPYIIVIIDELADLMIVVGREIEDLIQRLAQMARAVGIHLVLATQRPSVDVITGVIKANLPSRVAFQVLSRTDSRVILDSQGAEDLLGRGDMLFLATGAPKPVRLQGAFVTEPEVARVIQFIREQNFTPQYESAVKAGAEDSIVDNQENLQLLIRAARVVRESEKVSGDLLRADKEIGSKYDLALILLKKKGLIEKPKDTNRWHIHFDRLAEFLHAVDKEVG